MDLSVIIVSYNAREVLKRCLDAVFQLTTDLEFEVIVVDNGSTDGAIGVLKDYEKKYKNFKVVYSRENLGYARGNNEGMKIATGKYFLIINNDTLLIENSGKKMLDWMEAHHNIGISSCLLVDNEQKISSIISAGFFPFLPAIFAWAFFLDDLPGVKKLFKPFHVHSDITGVTVVTDFDWVSGSFMMVRREVFTKTGGFDENIFMYGEDLDFCYRVKQAGYKIGYNPETRAIHLGQASQKKMPGGYILGEFTGLKYFYAKHFPGWRQNVLDLLLDVVALLRIIFWLIRLNPQTAKIYLEALFQ